MTCPSTHDPHGLHKELHERNRGSAGSGLKAMLPGRAGGEEPGRDTLAPLVWPPGRTLPHPKVEQKAAQRLQSLPLPASPASLEEAGALEWLPAATTAKGLGFLLYRPDPLEASLPWGHSLPLCRALCRLPGNHHAWPHIYNLVLVPRSPG